MAYEPLFLLANSKVVGTTAQTSTSRGREDRGDRVGGSF